MNASAAFGTRAAQAMRRSFAFLGPAVLVSVGYMDPGNWATALEGGSRFGYTLLWVLVLANIMALALQQLSARLGIVTGLDLAQACRMAYPRPVVLALWGLCQIAIIACDLAEVIGSAVALNLLFHIPLAWGAVITALDVFVVLALQGAGLSRLEAIVVVLILTIAGCLALEVTLAHPDLAALRSGFVPRLPADALYVAIGILGATVMPHNLYLHSSLVQSCAAPTLPARRAAARSNLVSTLLALNLALLVNAAILVVAADVFHPAGVVVTDLRDAHRLLAPLLGATVASTLFAVALLCAGQSATLTGTMAGQIVMSGFLGLRVRPTTMRLGTRLLAILPAVLVIGLAGEDSTVALLVATQVMLSMQLPFAIVPLLKLTNSRAVMGPLANRGGMALLGVAIAAVVIAANGWLVAQIASEATRWRELTLVAALACASLLAYLIVVPLRWPAAGGVVPDRNSGADALLQPLR